MIFKESIIKTLFILVLAIGAIYTFYFFNSGEAQGPTESPQTNQEGILPEAGEIDDNNTDFLTGPTEDMTVKLTEVTISLPEALKKFGIPTLNFEPLRAWVVNDEFWYMEFKNDNKVGRALVEIGKGAPIQVTVRGYFVPGGNDWILEKGQDRIFENSDWRLYEYDKVLGVWGR